MTKRWIAVAALVIFVPIMGRAEARSASVTYAGAWVPGISNEVRACAPDGRVQQGGACLAYTPGIETAADITVTDASGRGVAAYIFGNSCDESGCSGWYIGSLCGSKMHIDLPYTTKPYNYVLIDLYHFPVGYRLLPPATSLDSCYEAGQVATAGTLVVEFS
ncbi:MAG: hypothetical protein ABR548_06320 [Actinomycetota bacterium]